MIVDAHTHWGRCFAERDGHDPARWLATLDAHGVTHAIVLPEAGIIHAGKIREDNDAVATVCRASNGRMIPFCTANIWYREEALEEIRRCLAAGFRGVKFHPWLQGCTVSSPVMDEVAELAAGANVPMLFHDGTPPFSLPSQIALLAQRHPRTTIILGHCGLFEHWREAIAALRHTPNLWACLCGPHTAAMRAIINGCDHSRLLWGSDFGFGGHDFISYRLPLLRDLGLNSGQLSAILHENPARLLRL